MASKSLNLLLNSALIAMAVGVVAFNTGLLNPYLPEKPADAGATTEESGSETPAAAEAKTDVAEASDEAASGEAATEEKDQVEAEKETEIAAVSDQSGQINSENNAEESASDAVDGGLADDGSPIETETGDSADPAVADIVPPRFDIVRVEPDGNVVIAGNATSGATVEVITGARTLGSTTATGEGDFAVILRDPLDPGDYTIVLRATSSDNVVAMSTETAIVSVPESDSGEVLAIVDEPGKPSKLITVPDADEEQSEDKAGEETELASAENPAESKDVSDVTAEQEEVAAAGNEAQENEAAEETAGENVAAGNESADGSDSTVASEQGQKPEEESVEAAALSQEESQPSGPSAVAENVEETPSEQESPIAPALEIAVEAVEIEGNHVFVAGTANPGKVVRVYANKDLIGETQSSEVGRFLVESNRGLAEGEYIIRADMLELGSAEVIARAAVPFEREAGDSIAAVAPKVEGTQEDAATGEAAAEPEAGAAESSDGGEATVAMADQKTDDIEQGTGSSAESESTSAEQATSGNATEAANSDAGQDGKTGADASGSEQIDTAASDGSAATSGQQSIAANQNDIDTAAGDSAAESETDAADNTGDTSESVGAEAEEPTAENDAGGQQSEVASGADASSASDSGGKTEASAAEATANETEMVKPAETKEETEVASAEPGTIKHAEFGENIALTAPKLEKTSGSVIIRRGDTLWRISRRVYGRGIRYTTIYTANREQIKNPHRIWPGQIFDVPGVSDDGEVADLEAIADQSPSSSESE